MLSKQQILKYDYFVVDGKVISADRLYSPILAQQGHTKLTTEQVLFHFTNPDATITEVLSRRDGTELQ